MPPDPAPQSIEVPVDPGTLDALAEALASRLAGRLRPDPDRLLTKPQLAGRLQCSERLIAALVARGELPRPLPVGGGLVRWDWSEVQKFLAGRRERKRRRGRGRYDRNEARQRREPGNGHAES